MAVPKNEDQNPPEKPDAETASGPEQLSASSKGASKKATHTNAYGDEVYVRKDLHSFVEARGYKPL